MKLAVKLLDDLVRNTPHLSLIVPIYYTKALKNNMGKPMIIRQAEALSLTLENLPIIIRPDELIVGTFDELVPVAIPRLEGSGFRIMNELERLPERVLNPISVEIEDIKILREELAPFYENYRVDTYAREIAPNEVFETSYSGSSYIATEVGGLAHAVIDYPRIISMGLKKYVELSSEKIRDCREALGSDPKADEKIAFYKAMKIISKALINYGKNYAQKAEDMAKEEIDVNRKKELEKIAKTCNNIPENPPEDLQEAIQFIWFIHMALHIENFEHGISFGRIDQYLMPYYDGDFDSAVRLTKNLILKTNEIIALYDTLATTYFGGMATTQNVLIGGMDKEGQDATNPLTYVVLRAIDEASVPSPNLVVRIHDQSPSELYEAIAEILAKGKNVIGLYNDEIVTKALMSYGVPLQEARNYGVVGCVGLSTSGTSFDNTGAVFLNTAKALELALGTDNSIVSQYIKMDKDPSQFKSMDDVLDTFREKLKNLMEMAAIAANAYQQAHAKLKPTPLMSLCIRGCFENGNDVSEGPAKYNFSGIHVTGFSDVVDSLAAIDWAVFRKKQITMEQLIEVLKNNFRGKKEMRNYLQYKCPKYGNDNENADVYAKKLAEILLDSIDGLRSARGGEYRVGIHAMTTHVGFGIFTGALPSGRKKGVPLNRDIAPGFTGEKGITAAIKSISKLDHSLLANGLACTLNINPEIAKIEKGKILESILRTYVKLGGSHLQFNAISLDMLKAAQENPEEHKDLMVRVSGYSARFVDLPKGVQDDIMDRYCYSHV
ncbi:MAG: formate C-acetyltransferase/glycerol dehydratase family glycyl radical enzyme [Promethearchaeota archaeon]|nr:MAG: formate C-acetyltransferase/glycerol dehydratase family glycyl radical enzyme [Candidatus Lokiarchaeota archaeon]